MFNTDLYSTLKLFTVIRKLAADELPHYRLLINEGDLSYVCIVCKLDNYFPSLSVNILPQNIITGIELATYSDNNSWNSFGRWKC